MGRKKKPINRTNIPQYQVEAIARCLLPDILAFYESEEGQREFAQWKKEQEEKKKEKESGYSKGGASSGNGDAPPFLCLYGPFPSPGRVVGFAWVEYNK